MQQLTYERTPKLNSMSYRYIYETLFIEGRDSDISVSALNQKWKLHKLYLSQSPYFSSMFNGNWKESNMDHIDITIVDPNVTLDSLNVTLGSLYQDEIVVEPADVISVLGMLAIIIISLLSRRLEAKISVCFDSERVSADAHIEPNWTKFEKRAIEQ